MTVRPVPAAGDRSPVRAVLLDVDGKVVLIKGAAAGK